MTEYRDCWIVRLGDLYLGGLGKSFINEACVGWVMTKIREHAEHFTSLESARSAAKALGGTVIKVAPVIKVGPPCCNRNGPGPNEPQPFYQKGGKDANGRTQTGGFVHDRRDEGGAFDAWSASAADDRKQGPGEHV